jgi:hypothetical protein
MVPVGVVRGKNATDDFNAAQDRVDADPNDTQARYDLQRAEFDGEQADSILIAGAVLFPLLLAGGITMIVFGARQKKRSQRGAARMQLTPSFGRGSAGFSLSGKF